MRELRPDTVVHVAWSGRSNRDRLERLQISGQYRDNPAICLDASVKRAFRNRRFGARRVSMAPSTGMITEQDLPAPTTAITVLRTRRLLA